MHIRFVKGTGAGNDFIVLDDRSGDLPRDKSALARVLCNRHFGVGGDGLLVLAGSKKADFTMLYFNSDGSTGGMCGNGGRVIARFASETGAAGTSMMFEALDRMYRAEVDGDTVALTLPDCTGPWPELDLEVAHQRLHGFRVDTGAPHFVVFVDDVESVDVHLLGNFARHHRAFEPAGTNVNFAAPRSDGTLELRTYERGVEQETLACGTGSVATAIAGVLSGRVIPPVDIHVRSGEILRVECTLTGGDATNVRLEGSARLLFTGYCRYDPDAAVISGTHVIPLRHDDPARGTV
jgi:diaminopimelate epimerase